MKLAELRRSLAADSSTPIVDTRPREEFSKQHIKGSLNIPIDELEMRAPHEIPASRTLLIYCNYLAECARGSKDQGTQTSCTATLKFLKDLGFREIKIIGDDLSAVQKAGVQLESDSH